MVGFTVGLDQLGPEHDLAVPRYHRKGASALFERDGQRYLAATVDVPEAPARIGGFHWPRPEVIALATTFDAVNFQGKGLEHYRR